MRHTHTRLVDDLVSGEHEIEIERARGIRPRALTSAAAFYIQEGGDQRARGEIALPHGCRVQEIGIVFGACANGFRLDGKGDDKAGNNA